MEPKRLVGWITPQLIVGIFCGGLGGQVLNLWWNRHISPSVTYTITKSTTGADATTQSLIPNLRLQIDNQTVTAIYTYVVEVTPQNGYLDTLQLALSFRNKPKIFGISTSAPSALHGITCKEVADGLVCTLTPLDARIPVPYRVVIGAAEQSDITPITTTQNVDFASLEAYAKRPVRNRDMWTWTAIGALYAIGFPLMLWYLWRSMRILRSRKRARGITVGHDG